MNKRKMIRCLQNLPQSQLRGLDTGQIERSYKESELRHALFDLIIANDIQRSAFRPIAE